MKTFVPVTYDVVVIGGGPAGMMAATTAAQAGAKVLLLEKNNQLGKKLAITGGGRCNVTNNKPVVRTMLSAYETAGKFLFSTFMQHGVKETVAWFAERGVPFKEENEGRLFPETESALTVVETLVNELKVTGVKVKSKTEVSSIIYKKDLGAFVVETNTGLNSAKACIVATGGYARPETGSTGDGFKWLKSLGHTIHTPDTALVPVALKTKWPLTLSGRTLEGVRVSVYAEGKKQVHKEGRVLLTHFGVSGPTILNLSKTIGDLLSYSPVTLKLDLFPQYDAGEFKEQLKEWLTSNKKLENALSEVLAREVVKALLDELSISGETPCHSVRSEERRRLAQYLKAVPLEVSHLLGSDKAVISSGGVALEEIDFRTMSSRLMPGLYIVGDLLNINRPSGGYSLQLCWSTGYVAGQSAGFNFNKSNNIKTGTTQVNE